MSDDKKCPKCGSRVFVRTARGDAFACASRNYEESGEFDQSDCCKIRERDNTIRELRGIIDELIPAATYGASRKRHWMDRSTAIDWEKSIQRAEAALGGNT